MRLQDKVVVVTGGSSGIGRAIAIRTANEGAMVVNADVRRTPRTDAVPTDELITDTGGSAAFFETDVTDLTNMRETMRRTVETFDGVDVVVNNAGRAASYALTDTDEENWQGTVELNLTGVYHGCLAGVERMLDADGGALVNVGSVFGVVGSPNSASYSAAKGGVIALTQQIARDYATKDIRANAVSPGFVDTPMFREDTHAGTLDYAERRTPMRRVGNADEIAAGVAFLASDDASFVTGHNLIIDGGYAMA
ncbi:SDR family NAD(P)-dependent oxidoreductase [Halomarina ordinaria]|uniref:SDR family NAD(P)-dependent oxidoreductase n=1 Tax=Halomarina ordinaria TaxID=3033939 RepID=A0ABD5UE11_9EURY|nr:SDR family NAD(P)-dependent oxidoreductase [Halomarina sp. PSRA2]